MAMAMAMTANSATYSNAMRNRPFQLANVISPAHRRYLNNLYLMKEIDRLASFCRWPASQRNITPAELAREGFFYLGDSDRTQCFSCSGVLRNWSYEDNASEEHRNHFPNCKMVQKSEVLNVPITQDEESPENRRRNYPCQYPSNPHMRNEDARLATFDQRWPSGAVRASPAEIAQAGFYFLGERDRVKCWYCNGGLQNWEYEDSPWIEHAKWFPSCQNLQQKRGVKFVYHHLSAFPHLSRPIIARQEGSPLVQDQRQLGINSPVRQPARCLEIIDPREQLRQRNEKVSRILTCSQAVYTVKGMGFEQNMIREVIADSVDKEEGENIWESAVQLLDAVVQLQENSSSSVDLNPSSSCSNLLTRENNDEITLCTITTAMETEEEMNENKNASPNIAPSSEAIRTPVNEVVIKEKLDKLLEERQCKVCWSEEADVLFLPCSHMCCCMECTKSLLICPICRKQIEKAMKTYQS